MGKEKNKKELVWKEKEIEREKITAKGLKKHPCKKGKGEHIFELKKIRTYYNCEWKDESGLCSHGIEANEKCEKGVKNETIFEEWRCKNCNKKDWKIIRSKIRSNF